jgi:membrane protease YdiL (CAAX protease family)
MRASPDGRGVTLLSLLWLVVQAAGASGFYLRLLPLGLLFVWLSHRDDSALWRPTPRSLVWGVGAGVVMTALTYPAFAFASMLWTGLPGALAPLYVKARVASPLWEIPACLVIVAGEEALWRHLAPKAWLGRGLGAAWLFSLGTYAVAQAGTGSWLVVVAALLCGAVWSGLRFATGSLVAPLVCHTVWTLTVVVAYPLV